MNVVTREGLGVTLDLNIYLYWRAGRTYNIELHYLTNIQPTSHSLLVPTLTLLTRSAGK